jgi:hypothetical protein
MKAKNFTLLVLGILFSSISLCRAQNILNDGNFSTTTVINSYFDQPAPDNVWYAWQNWQINNNVTIDSGICKYDIATLGAQKNTWDIQLVQTGFPLIQGHSYRLSFDVKADANRSFGLYLGENGGNWISIIGYNNYIQYAGTDWKTLTIDFMATSVFNSHKLSFELGEEQVVTYFDNVMLVDLGIAAPSIGILGTSLNSWDVDVDMQTTDGIKYTLLNYPLAAGLAKFRQDNSWSINWGSDTFPSGIGIQDGQNIPIPSFGNYDIIFNRITGEYSFVCVSNCPNTIGILGSAVPPDFSWNIDVSMGTYDGINYTLKNYTFIDGEAKFRQNDSWSINWGDSTFPTGVGVQGGANIPVKAGNYNVTFNSITGYYSFEIPMIGIIGTALNGWDTDIDMQTTDGITYTLLNYPFNDGYAKFRQDNSWDTNWGGYDFPKGFGFLYGPDIYIQAGTYDVTFNRITGEYAFVATTCPIAGIQCFGGYGYSEPGMCGANVYYEPPIPAANCGGEGLKIEQTSGLASGSFFPTGYTTNTFLLTNAEGKTATCSSTVYVGGDNEPPVITGISDQLPQLWPPNHKMVPIHLDYTTTDNCDQNSISQIFYVYSNEADNGLGDGDMANDWKIVDDHNILLRAERSGTGTGRVYYISILSHDNSNNFSLKQITVAVPHDKGGKVNTARPTKKETISSNSIENVPFTTTVWPNPSTNSFNLEVQSTSNEKVVLNVFDLNGRLLSNFNANSNQTTLFGKDLKAGTYLVLVRQGNNSNTIKVVKQ